jgi:2-methylcitrate dehydratase PrpD
VTGPTLADTLARFAADASFERLPAAVVQSTKQRVLDTLGICLAASAQGLADGVADLVGGTAGREEASLVGLPERYPAPQAALVNGTLAHSLDFDDTHLPSVLHPSASSVPAALAMAQAAGRSGRDAIAAAAVGIEMTVRVGMGGYLPNAGNVWFERGWHATSICGTLGTAAAGARLLGLDATGIRDALGIAASMAGGVIEANRAGGTVKRLHCGWAGHSGLTAALLAQHGYTGPATVFEGRFGLFEAFLGGRFDADAVISGLGERWEVPGIFFKPYPANHYTHAGIDAALALRRKHGLDPRQIARIELGAPGPVLRTIGEPREEKLHPRSGYHAQFSGPFTVATALLGGGGLGVYFDDFTDAKARDPEILALAARVHSHADEECSRIFPRQFPAVLRVTMQDGTVYEERVLHNRGGPGNPLSDAELRQKFALNASRLLPREQVDRLADAAFALDRAEGVDELLSLCRVGGLSHSPDGHASVRSAGRASGARRSGRIR